MHSLCCTAVGVSPQACHDASPTFRSALSRAGAGAQVRFSRALPAQLLSSAALTATVIPWVCQAARPGVPYLPACIAKGAALQACLGAALPLALLYTHEAHTRRSFLAALQRA